MFEIKTRNLFIGGLGYIENKHNSLNGYLTFGGLHINNIKCPTFTSTYLDFNEIFFSQKATISGCEFGEKELRPQLMFRTRQKKPASN